MACCHFVLRMGILYWKSEVFSIFSFLFHLLITGKNGTVLNISAADKFTTCRPEMRLSMDYYQNQNNEMNQNIPQIDPKYRGLSIASMVCGICSLVLCCTGLLSIPAGALGILFAMLTRKKGQRMSSMCVAGIWLSCVGLARSAALSRYLPILLIGICWIRCTSRCTVSIWKDSGSRTCKTCRYFPMDSVVTK